MLVDVIVSYRPTQAHCLEIRFVELLHCIKSSGLICDSCCGMFMTQYSLEEFHQHVVLAYAENFFVISSYL